MVFDGHATGWGIIPVWSVLRVLISALFVDAHIFRHTPVPQPLNISFWPAKKRCNYFWCTENCPCSDPVCPPHRLWREVEDPTILEGKGGRRNALSVQNDAAALVMKRFGSGKWMGQNYKMNIHFNPAVWGVDSLSTPKQILGAWHGHDWSWLVKAYVGSSSTTHCMLLRDIQTNDDVPICTISIDVVRAVESIMSIQMFSYSGYIHRTTYLWLLVSLSLLPYRLLFVYDYWSW